MRGFALWKWKPEKKRIKVKGVKSTMQLFADITAVNFYREHKNETEAGLWYVCYLKREWHSFAYADDVLTFLDCREC